MTRVLERPDEDTALRQMPLEGLEAAMEHCRNALQQAEDEGDLRLARVYARQQDRVDAELLARRAERETRDSQAEATGEWTEVPP